MQSACNIVREVCFPASLRLLDSRISWRSQLLQENMSETLIQPRGAREGSFDAYFWVRDANALFPEFKSKGADIAFEPIDRKLYGMREFAVRDLDGHVLIFAHDISDRIRSGEAQA
jgi:uncharacterized glyoxalase superfamily protein PhnB